MNTIVSAALYFSSALLIALQITLAIEALLHRRKLRKASLHFRETYTAWKRAAADPYSNSADLHVATERAAARLRHLRP
jgi:hypothetical protein